MTKINSFINRKQELEQLEKEYFYDKENLVVIYGRRRVGKTTLIEEFIKSKQAIYFMADMQLEKDQINRLRLIISKFFDDRLISNIEFNNWDGIFEYLLGKYKFENKLILVLDEFQYLAKINNAFPSIFQRIWDLKLKNKNIMVILCGSLVNMMYATTLSYSSPLYGRRTLQIKLNPVSFHYYKDFFPEINDKKILLQYYAVTGGVPKYIDLFNPKLSFWANVKDIILSKNGYLYNEPRFILNEEISESATYFSILKAISEGEHKIGKIAAKIGIKVNIITKYLDILMGLDVLERKVPVTEDNPEKSKMGLYFIKDLFFNFWFRYVFRYQSYLEIGDIDYVLKSIKEDFSNYLGFVYEKICVGNIPYLSKTNYMPFIPDKWGGWWNKNQEIDVVAIKNETKEIFFGECKWHNQRVGRDILHELKSKADYIDWNKGNRKEYYAVFSKSGFTDELLEISNKEKNVFLFEGVA